MFNKLFLFFIVFLGLITFAQSESSWIKKKDKSDKVEKVEKVEKKKTHDWIKKKKVKENKKKLKEKIKESKSWITKKSKDKVKDIKEKLKKYKNINNLPEAELYFSVFIKPNENEEAQYIYGYINSDKKSEKTKKFKFNNKSFYSLNDGIAFFDDKKTTCEIDVLKDVIFNELKGKALIKCKNKTVFSADINFEDDGKFGKGYDVVYKDGRSAKIEFFEEKEKNIAKLENYKVVETTVFERQLPKRNKKKIILKPNGKYYALLIGNSNYKDDGWDDLVSPVNDIRAIKKILDKSYNFEKIIMVEDGTEKRIFNAFKELSELTTSNDYVLIYFSGHGFTNEFQQAYWIPTDGSKEEGQGDWINIIEMDNYFKKIKAHHLAVMVDSCYVGGKFKGVNLLDNMSEEMENMFGKNLEDDLNLRARSVLSSGTSGRVSDTVSGTNHSLFALTFINTLKQFEKKSLPINMDNVALNIKLYFQGNYNKPMLYNPPTWKDGGGNFIFIPKSNLQ